MERRPLNQKERDCINEAMVPYGLTNYPLQGGSMTIEENGNIVYFLNIGGLDPLGIQAKKMGKKFKDVLGADEIYLQSVKVV